MAETVKMKDIAQKLGISVVTVSNALSGKKGVSDKVRSLVLETAQAMNYGGSNEDEPRDKKTIGVIVAHRYIRVDGSFYWAMYQQLVFAAAQEGNLMMLEILQEEQENTGELPRILQEEDVDGMIVIGKMREKYVEGLLKNARVPVVLLDYYPQNLICDCVMSNNYLGAYKVTRYLLKKGHENIGYIGKFKENENLCDRYFGYQKGMEEWGITVNPQWVFADTRQACAMFGQMPPESRPTAFVCCSDVMARYLYDGLTQMNFRIPEDISVVGYDNYLHGHSFASQLTTYNVDLEEMTRKALGILMKKIDGRHDCPGVCYLDSYIVERGSVRVCKR